MQNGLSIAAVRVKQLQAFVPQGYAPILGRANSIDKSERQQFYEMFSLFYLEYRFVIMTSSITE